MVTAQYGSHPVGCLRHLQFIGEAAMARIGNTTFVTRNTANIVQTGVRLLDPFILPLEDAQPALRASGSWWLRGGMPEAGEYEDVPGFCKSATLDASLRGLFVCKAGDAGERII
jgi:hypothetical protein